MNELIEPLNLDKGHALSCHSRDSDFGDWDINILYVTVAQVESARIVNFCNVLSQNVEVDSYHLFVRVHRLKDTR